MNAATAARVSANMTIKEASAASGLNVSTIRNLECGRQSPSVRTLVLLSRVYGCPWYSICPETLLTAPEVTK